MKVEDLIALLDGNNGYLFVIFESRNCPHCEGLSGLIRDICLKCGGRFIEITVEDYPETARAYGIESKPTVIIFFNSDFVDQVVGRVADARYEQNIKS